MNKNPEIVILGMGPCGLGAAWRLEELGYKNYRIFEKLPRPGGLAYSFTDPKGFTWDIGGHIHFSHYQYFDDLMDFLGGNDWLYHDRSSWIWIKGRFVPYPFQNNIRHLPKEDIWRCLQGLIDLYVTPVSKPQNFQDWILAVFGSGMAEMFMFPYNFKVWGYPPEMLSYSWIGERVVVTDLKRVVENVLFERDDLSWGPNSRFRYPLRGGTGEIWKRLYMRLNQERAFLNHEVVEVHTKNRYVLFKDGRRVDYDVLISTLPLDKFILISDLKDKRAALQLLHSSTHIVGIGLRGKTPDHLKKKCWMYFPESDSPFYRVTVLSNYSPNHVPSDGEYWSLMGEVSESEYKPVDTERIQDQSIQGLLNTKLITENDEIVDIWTHREPYGYPTPTLNRDKALLVLRELEERHIFCRGRFGAWKYEVSNQDHSLMQGVEVVNRVLLGEEETTVWDPQKVNASQHKRST